MTVDLTWFIGKRLLEVEKLEIPWHFLFTDNGHIQSDFEWRLITSKGIEVVSSDHGHRFGLKEPVDAIARVLTAVQNKKIIAVRIAESP